MRRSVVVSTLGITQTLAWGSTYYLAAIFADPISDTLQLPHAWFFGIFSASLLLSGLLGPLAGRMIDKHGGRDVLAATNLVFAAGLVCLSFASGIFSLIFAWALIGIGMGFGLYEAAFATATGLYGREARNAITGITLFAGFASTVGWPTSALFIEHFGWRGACVAWAVLHLVIGLPMNRLLIPKAVPQVAEMAPAHVTAPAGIPWTIVAMQHPWLPPSSFHTAHGESCDHETAERKVDRDRRQRIDDGYCRHIVPRSLIAVEELADHHGDRRAIHR